MPITRLIATGPSIHKDIGYGQHQDDLSDPMAKSENHSTRPAMAFSDELKVFNGAPCSTSLILESQLGVFPSGDCGNGIAKVTESGQLFPPIALLPTDGMRLVMMSGVSWALSNRHGGYNQLQ